MSAQTISRYRMPDGPAVGGTRVMYKIEDHRLRRLAFASYQPNIRTIDEIDEDGGRPFVAMEQLTRMTLKHRVLLLTLATNWRAEATRR